MAPLHVFAAPPLAARAAAVAVAERLRGALAARERARLIVTGGSTPAPAYAHLAGLDLPWDRIDVFLSDERFVPADHADSNERLIRETLPQALLHPFPTALADAQAAADAFDQQLRSYFHPGEPRFDVALLGVGADAHVASLFPGAEALDAGERLALATTAPPEHPVAERLTLTLPALNAADAVYFLVTGDTKREAVARSLRGETPAGRVRGRIETAWFTDAHADPS